MKFTRLQTVHLRPRWQFQDLFAPRPTSVAQPDLTHAGGISEVRRIAAMAESRDILLAAGLFDGAWNNPRSTSENRGFTEW